MCLKFQTQTTAAVMFYVHVCVIDINYINRSYYDIVEWILKKKIFEMKFIGLQTFATNSFF